MDVRGLVMMCAPGTEDALVHFVEEHADVISLFRVTTPSVVLERIRHCLGENKESAMGVEMAYLGGDSQVATQMVLHDVGAALIFRDPIGASGAACDCDALLRLINVHNIMNATNPSTAEMLMHVLREGMTTSAGMVDVMPSFYESLESPAVAAYKAKQNAIIASHSSVSKPVALPAVGELEELTNANVEELTKNSKLLDFQAARESGRNSGRQTSGRAKTPRGWQGRAERMAKLRHAVAEIELGVRLAGKTCHKQADLEQAKSMRCLALISHNNMKGAMKEFVIRHQKVLKRFRLTGTNSTMTMLKSVLGTDDVAYGPTCSSGPLGGDAEVGALMCVEDLGGMFFFTDPLDPHPHAADINALIRMCDVHNLMHASNPTTGDALARVLEQGLRDLTKIPTFFTTHINPAVEWHETNINGNLYKPPVQSGFLKGDKMQLATAVVCVLALMVGAYRAGAAR